MFTKFYQKINFDKIEQMAELTENNKSCLE